MIRKSIYVFAMMALISCSSDSDPVNTDDGQQPTSDLKLSRFIFNKGLPTPEHFEYEFEDPKFIDKSFTENGQATGIHGKYFYNSSEKLYEISTYNSNDEFVNNIYELEYTNNNLSKLKVYSSGPSNPHIVDVSYAGNEINFVEQGGGRTAKLIIQNGKVVTTIHDSGPSTATRSELSYNTDGTLMEVNNFINDFLSYTVTFSHSDVVNPLFESYKANEIAFLALSIFDTDFTGTYNPYTQFLLNAKVVSGDSTQNEEYVTEYNTDNYPIEIKAYRDGELRSTQNFEYIE